MEGLQRVLGMSEYGSINNNNAPMSLSIPGHGWILLNVPTYLWKNCSMPGFSTCLMLDIWHGFEYASGIKCARVLSMLW